jgi:hypothetical protein
MTSREAWDAAVERFTDGYGAPPDFTDEDDVGAFAQIFAEVAAASAASDLAAWFDAATERLREVVK